MAPCFPLTKVYRHGKQMERKQDISCFRVYDDDMPDFPLAIDRYESIAHVSEYARPHGMEPDEHAAWLDGCIDVISEVLDISPELIYMKFRQRQSGLQQYERFGRTNSEYIVRENGLRFVIKPADYLDVGLFLDHRNTRKMVMEEARGKQVLNLFAYTGSFSVYAAAGGCSRHPDGRHEQYLSAMGRPQYDTQRLYRRRTPFPAGRCATMAPTTYGRTLRSDCAGPAHIFQ